MASRTDLRERPAPIRIPSFGVFALSSRHGSRFRMPYETRPFDKLAFVSAGAGSLDHDRGQAPVGEGDVMFVPAGARHRFRDAAGAPLTLHLLCVDWRRVRPGAATRRAFVSLVRRLGPLRARRLPDVYARAELAQKLRRLVFEQTRRGVGFDVLLEAGLAEWLVTVARGLSPRSSPVSARAGARAARFAGTLSFVDNHFHEPLRVGVLAAQAGMSYRSYTSHFRREVGRSFAAYVARKRVDHARERLRAGASIIDAALDAGFGDVSGFYRVFRRLTGTTPGRSRNQGRSATIDSRREGR